MLKNIVNFWSDIYKPDAIVSISNEVVSKYVNHLIKRSLFKIIAENKKPSVIWDKDMSGVLEAEIYYIGRGTKKHLINCINKNCGANLDHYTKNIKLVMDDKDLIFIQSSFLHTEAYYKELQMYNFFQTVFLKDGIIFDHCGKYRLSDFKGCELYKRAMYGLLKEV